MEQNGGNILYVCERMSSIKSVNRVRVKLSGRESEKDAHKHFVEYSNTKRKIMNWETRKTRPTRGINLPDYLKYAFRW